MEYPFKTEPYRHQKDGWELSKNRVYYGLFWQMGCGKTKTTLDTGAYLYDRGIVTTIIIVAPKSVYRNWVVEEVPAHLPEHIRHHTVAWTPRPTKAEQKELDGLLSPLDMVLKIFSINIDAVITKKGFAFMDRLLRLQNCMLVVDESVTIKNPKAQRTKALLKLGRYAKIRRILTGLATPNSPLDLYPQCEFLEPGVLGFGSFYAFRNRYAVMRRMHMGMRSFDTVVGYQNLDELSHKLSYFSSRVTKEDCLDLPEKVYETREVELTPEQKKAYETLRKSSVLFLSEENVITSTLVLTKLTKLHQIVCGHVRDDDGNDVIMPSNRISVLMEILEDFEGKAIVWCNYRKDVVLVEAALKKVYGAGTVRVITGDTPSSERQDIVGEMQEGAARFLVSTRAAAKGVTLTAATLSIYYSNSFDLDTRAQSEDRCHRIGQKNTVTYVDLIARGTIDEKILAVLKSKQSLAEMVMTGNWKEFF